MKRKGDIAMQLLKERIPVSYTHLSFKSTGAVVLAVGSWEYRNEYARFCYFMLADINILCIINTILIGCFRIFSLYSHGNRSIVFFTGGCLKDLLQSACPCPVSYTHLDVYKRQISCSCHFPDFLNCWIHRTCLLYTST